MASDSRKVTKVAKLALPERLQKGDKVALIAPAFHFDREAFKQGRDYLERHYGVEAVFLENVFEQEAYFAGNDERRLEELLHWICDPTVKALLAIRGGYGCARVYPEFIKRLQKKKKLTPKIIAGYSDLTILLNGLYQDLGWTTFHCPALTGRPFRDPLPLEIETFSRALFSNAPLGPITFPDMFTFEPGKAKARIVGGCLTLLANSLGTSYEIQTDHKILFIEEVDERPYRIDRMLTQLIHAGKFNKIRGLVFGQLFRCDPPKEAGHPTSHTSAFEAVRLAIEPMVRAKKIPTLFQFPSGHGTPQITFPIGVEVELHASRTNPKVIFKSSGVR